MPRSRHFMEQFCEEAGCSDRLKMAHAWKWTKKRWHSHPSSSFIRFWMPFDTDPVSGAQVGGHPEARRKWARKDPDGWKHGWYGVPLLDAWNTEEFYKEWEAWVEAGEPEPEKPFVSISATLERQKQFWQELKPLLRGVAKPIP